MIFYIEIDLQNSKAIENDLIIFLEFYFVIAKENIETILNDISFVKSSLTFWLNFAQNFKDKSFIALIQSNIDKVKTDFIKTKLKEILSHISSFLEKNLSTEENYQKLIKENLFELVELLLRFDEIFQNIQQSEVKYILEDKTTELISRCFQNFIVFSQINLEKLKEAFYEKVGYSFLDFKGNFLWADKYTQEILFDQCEINNMNLFELMTDFSKYIIRNKYGDKFFDFKEENCRIRVFTYSISLKKEEDDSQGEKCLKTLFQSLNSVKTLVSRASAVLLQNFGEKSHACILLETKLSPFRQNFDYFQWKKYID